ERQAIYFKGPSGAGKTVLLLQFARQNAARSLVFFGGNDPWLVHPRRFLADMVAQLRALLGKPDRDVDADGFDRLSETFSDLWAAFVREVRQDSEPFYLVLDDVDPSGAQAENISSVLPRRLPPNVYLLAAGNGSLLSAIPSLRAEARDMPLFSS